jgi:transposase InsO family protein
MTSKDPDAVLRTWLRTYAKDHPRRGFRPAYHDARGDGWVVNHKKIQRLWREEGLRVPQRRRRKRHGISTAPDPVIADAPNRVWAVDFQFDVTTPGGRSRSSRSSTSTPANAWAGWSSAASPASTSSASSTA